MDLIDLGIYGCGTLRINRKHFPQQLRNDAKWGLANRGDYKIAQSGCLTVNLWQDNQPVLVIASNCNPIDVTTVKRRVRDGTRSDFSCPTAIASYNKYMGGVDRNDQLRQYYSIRLKGRKCYKYIWWFLVDLAITNAYILHKHDTSMSITSLKDFRVTLAKELIGSYMTRKR